MPLSSAANRLEVDPPMGKTAAVALRIETVVFQSLLGQNGRCTTRRAAGDFLSS